jgi:phosphoribosylanthranilate isomerase
MAHLPPAELLFFCQRRTTNDCLMTWVKICGITNLEDALTAVDAGADAVGFVFHDKSPRKIDPETAREIVAKLPDAIEKVGVFVEQTTKQIRETVDRVGLTAVQLYQQAQVEVLTDRQELASSKTRPQVKIIFVIPGDKLADGVHPRSGFWGISKGFKDSLFALLVDSTSATRPGGTGRRFDWTRVRGLFPTLGSICPTIVAGGLEPTNVGVAITLLHPRGVDVASGVELRPGKKDPEKVHAFVEAVRRAGKKS